MLSHAHLVPISCGHATTAWKRGVSHERAHTPLVILCDRRYAHTGVMSRPVHTGYSTGRIGYDEYDEYGGYADGATDWTEGPVVPAGPGGP